MFSRFKTKIQPAIDAFNKFKERVSSALSTLWNKVSSVVSNIYNVVRNKFEEVRATIASKLNEIIQAVKGWVETIWEYISGLAEWFYNAGANIMQGLYNGLLSVAGTILSWVANFVAQIMDTFTSLLGIFSPSKVFYGYGINITQGLAHGLKAGQKYALKNIDDLGTLFINQWTRNAAAMKPAIKDLEGNVQRLVNVIKKLKKKGIKKNERGPLTEAQRDLSKARDAAAALRREYAAAQKFIENFTSAYEAYMDRLNTALEGRRDWNFEKVGGTPLQKAQNLWSELTSEMASYQDEWRQITGNLNRAEALRATVDRFKDAWEDAASALESAKDNLASWLQEIGPLSRENVLRGIYDDAKSSLDDLMQQQLSFADALAGTVRSALNLSDALDKSRSLKNKGSILAALRDQAAQSKEYAEAIRALQTQGASQELINQIQQAGLVDGMAIMKRLTTPEAINEANGLVKDIMSTADALGKDMGAVFYDNQIYLAQQAVKAATADMTKFYEAEIARSQVAANDAKKAYVAQLTEAMRQVGIHLTAATGVLDTYWWNQVSSAKNATQQLLAIWTDYAKKHKGIFDKYGVGDPTRPYGTGAYVQRPQNVTNNITYNIKGQSGKEIVREIQQYERVSGASWRR